MAYTFDFGKYEGKDLDDISLIDLDNYLSWLEKQENPSRKIVVAKSAIKEYFKDPVIEDEWFRATWSPD